MFFSKSLLLKQTKWSRWTFGFQLTLRLFLSSSSLLEHLNRALWDIEQHFDSFVERGSGCIVKRVSQFCFTVNSFKLFTDGCKKSTLPECLRARRSCMVASAHCFLNCLVAGVAKLKRNPAQWCTLYSEIE